MKSVAHQRYLWLGRSSEVCCRQIFWQDSRKPANSYYFDKNGDVPLRPASIMEIYWRSRLFPLRNFAFSRRRQARATYSSAD